MTNYTIAAIPTLYRGRMYRSRLEARWAAFFDRLGWKHEYEPFDLGAWSPDFAITEPFDALIEVKPHTEPDYDLFERAQTAAGKRPVFITRVAPVLVEKGPVSIGWWAASYWETSIWWTRLPDQPVLVADFISFTSDGETWVSGTNGYGPAEKGKGPDAWSYRDYTMRLWADACNAVQWEPKQ
jgi:hypothetical protein